MDSKKQIEDLQINVKKKNKIARVLAYVAAVVVIIFVCSYLCYHFLTVFDDVYMTGVVKDASAPVMTELDLVLFRDDTVLEADKESDDVVRFMVSNGEKVGVSGELVRIYGDTEMTLLDAQDLRAEIEAIDEELQFIDRVSDVRHMTFYAAGINAQNAFKGFISARGEYLKLGSDMTDKTENFVDELVRFNIVKNGKGEIEKYREELLNKKAELENKYSGEYLSVCAQESCYFYDISYVDGYESKFSINAVQSLSADGLRKLLNSTPDAVSDRVIGKTTNSYECYFASIADKETASRFETGIEYTFTFESGEKITAVLERVGAVIKNESILVFKCSVMPKGFALERVSRVSVKTDEHNGLAVPESAVYDVEGVKVVYCLESGKLVMKRADIFCRENGICIISNGSDAGEDYEGLPYPKFNDVIIISGNGLYDGKVIG